MPHDYAPARQPLGFAARILTFLGLVTEDKSCLCTDRMAALDDPATRRAIAHLPAHLLHDIGAVPPTASVMPVEGEALRRYMW
ncbi:hypothetical protein GL279_04925 [Paracoccus limosus]|jgi:hypothetical protein|uniref:Uncharacterized protein n=1 Tax=Paracoccus limosus TaxID=913252 RepID=A0A844H6I5_9RHOB|nr:hypothetical protein [Paracoccus limosus]MTH33938.1 hypothetical protein [Paracoccus limosus]